MWYGLWLCAGGFALVHSFVVALLVLVLCGAGATMTMTVANTLLQIYVPMGMRGRVMSLYTLIAAGLTPLGALFVSGLGTRLGLEGATIVAGTAAGIVVMIGYRKLRELTPR